MKIFIRGILCGGFWCAVVWNLSGCLLTRSEVADREQKKQFQEQVVTLQKTYADQQNQGQELLEQMRVLTGRVEALETQAQQKARDSEEKTRTDQVQLQEMQKRIAVLQDELVSLKSEVEVVKERSVRAALADSNGVGRGAGSAGGPVEAEEAFQAKEWRRAAVLYQKWREKNPKHRAYPEATYKLGVALVEQGMKEEAAVFFEEVIRKYSGSSSAKKSQAALKKLK